jgi:hypothetical protein
MTLFSQSVTLDFGCLGEHEVQADYSYSPGRPGKMYMPNGDPGYPEEPAEIEILNVYLYGLNIISQLPDSTYDSLLDTLINNHYYED